MDEAASGSGLRFTAAAAVTAAAVPPRRTVLGSSSRFSGRGGWKLYLEYLRHDGAVVARRQRHPGDARGQADEEVARRGREAHRHGGRLEDVRGEALRVSFSGS